MSRRRSAHQAGRAECFCPACRAKQTAEGQTRIAEYNAWATTKTTTPTQTNEGSPNR